MQDGEYDIVVVGGGPAGSSAAYAAARAGASVILLEKEDEIALTVRTSGVTWTSDAESFGIPPKYYNPVRNYSFLSANREVTVQDGAARAAVLDVRGTYRWLAARAEGAGARIFTGTPATGVIMEGGRVAGVTAGGARLRAGVVIDASGFQSAVSKHAGLPHSWSRFGAGAEYEIRAENADPDTWWLMVGSKYSPAGYAWIFPVGGDIVRVGVGVGKPESGADPRVLLDRIMKEDAGPVAALGRTEMIESHYGLIPNDGPSRRTAYDGLLLVGDSAGQANPLVLEGIRYAIRFGGLAGETAASAAAAGDTSFGALKAYEDRWTSAVRSRLRAAGRVQKRWLGLDDAGWDREVDIIRALGADEFVDFVRADFAPSRMARLAARHPVLAARRLFEMVRG